VKAGQKIKEEKKEKNKIDNYVENAEQVEE
jgi:hypothetical protein